MGKQRHLTNTDLFAILNQWAQRADSEQPEDAIARMLLRDSLSGRIYFAPLMARRAILAEGMNLHPDEGRTLAARQRQAEQRLMGFGRSLHGLCLLLEGAPDITPERQRAAALVRKTLVPSRMARRYADIAAVVTHHQEALQRLQPELLLLGDDARRWATGLVAEEQQITSDFYARSMTKASRYQRPGGRFRAEVLRLLNDFRQGLSCELIANPALPRHAVELLFGIQDRLVSSHRTPKGQETTPNER